MSPLEETVQTQNIIPLIRQIRELTGLGLADAKKIVESLMCDMGLGFMNPNRDNVHELFEWKMNIGYLWNGVVYPYKAHVPGGNWEKATRVKVAK